MKPFFVTVPHAGELIPPEASWLKKLPEPVVMCDVDRFVDDLYRPAVQYLGLAHVMAQIHRYVVDLNRWPEDIDQDSVEGSKNPSGKFPIGFHWSRTTTEVFLMTSPMSRSLHDSLVKTYFDPFHNQVKALFRDFKSQGHAKVYHLDAHSMPSQGTAAHRDPGTKRPEIVVSDRDGTSCEPEYKDIVIRAYESVNFQVAYNWPYKGGRITETYGQPQQGQHTLQVEMNRSLYMDEFSKQKLPGLYENVQKRVTQALAKIYEDLHG